MSQPRLSSCGFLSDTAAFNLSDLLREGPRDLSMVIDLLEFAQTAMLSEQVYVTPDALKRSDFLRDLEFVTTVDVAVAEDTHDGGLSDEKPEILVDLDERQHLIANQPAGDLALAMAHSENLRAAPIFSRLCNLPGSERRPEDQRLRSLRHVMVLAQFSRDILRFESEESRAVFLEKLAPALEAFQHYSVSLYRLGQHWGLQTLTSVLEQPLLALTTLDFPLRDTQSGNLIGEIQSRLDAAALAIPGRKEFFEEWRIPPLGIISLRDCKDAEKLCDAILLGRDRFGDLRESIRRRSLERQELLEAADFTSLAGEKALRELAALDAETMAVLQTFDERIQETHAPLARTERVFNLLDYTLAFIGGLDFGILGFVSEKLGLKQRAVLQRIPGLLRAQSEIARGDELLALEWVSRLLPDLKQVRGQKLLLNIAYGHAGDYCAANPEEQPEEFTTFSADDFSYSDREFWVELVSGAASLHDALIDGSLFGESDQAP
ncbi:MAG: hypothetical protein AAGL66_09105 [Pseudomonadota bacterium]